MLARSPRSTAGRRIEVSDPYTFCSLTTSAGARRYYDAHRAKGNTHRRALRSLANRWVGILHGCLKHRARYSEQVAWPTLEESAA